ncbi:uncharacterized protein N7515_010378 [Penicillium bovifimosum]|uniref:Uncharacterized protein n=1 Tax=Penicillium bovifimosum TaxID=126998 RepID=A0A9W9GFD3_9EURO|nr:uncharacterized protein N7515_010378 [Penicillium bovifimosum]KAJ5118155.1 hypothetical protein N7515_010378 [Penicillium bovifimosum]
MNVDIRFLLVQMFHEAPESRIQSSLWCYKWRNQTQFKENKAKQVSGQPRQRTKQTNFSAVDTTSTTDDRYEFPGMAIQADENITMVAIANHCNQSRTRKQGEDWILDFGCFMEHLHQQESDVNIHFLPTWSGTEMGHEQW